uniref:Uncharacterized protein n=1 Tax=Oryza punctata TaxID=4537 RepID=A0A0E0JGG9_ORYPU
MQSHTHAHALAGSPAATAPSSPTRRPCTGNDDDDDDDAGGGGGQIFFFSAPASPVHYILRSPPSSTTTTAAHYSPGVDGDYGCGGGGDFEFAARQHGAGDGAAAMSSAEELFVAGRIRVGCLSPIRQEEAGFGEQEEGCEDEGEGGGGQRPRPRRARSASPPRSPHLAKIAEPSDFFASASSSSSSSTSSSLSSSAKNTRRRISLRDLLLGGTANSDSATATATAADAGTGAGGAAAERSSGFWPPSIWPSSRSKKTTTIALPCPCPCPPPLQSARRSTSSDRSSAPRRRTTSLPYRQGLVLGCLGFGARSYGLAKSMHPLSSR